MNKLKEAIQKAKKVNEVISPLSQEQKQVLTDLVDVHGTADVLLGLAEVLEGLHKPAFADPIEKLALNIRALSRR